MKYAIEPHPWEETIEVLDAAGFERAPLYLSLIHISEPTRPY